MTASETSRWATGGRSNSPDATAGRDPPLLRLELLGGFRVTLGDQVIEEPAWRLRKARSLVKLLALAPEHVLHRDQLLDLLWPNLNPDAAANNLRYTLHVTRGVLQAAGPTRLRVLETLGERLVLYPAGPIWVDVDAFERAAAGARRTTDPAAYHAAIDVYAGDLLPDDRYEDWAAKRREALRTTCLALLVDVAWLHETREEHALAIAALVRAIALEPAHEQAHVGLMRLYALAGQRTQALRQYRQLQAALRDELDAEPEPASQELYAEIVAGRFPAAGRQPARGAMQPIVADRRHNLPIHPTRFIGRSRELVEVKALLTATTTRLLTLTGAGGSGKTRLALAVATDLAPIYPDGVWLVELAGIAAPQLVPAAVAAALGFREEPGRALTETLRDALRLKQLLLVLDNCEHLIEPVADLAATLLSVCPDVHMLATSREALRVAGELNWRVPSLAVPDHHERLTLEDLREVGSVGLFLDRVYLRQPDFVLSAQNARPIAEICRRLDGLPLAIELAAARTPVLSAPQLAERLSDALAVLTDGSRTAVPRHRTLRATLDWSYALLDPREQLALNRLATFAGGWMLEAAEAVVAGDGIEEREVLDLLARLVDKSLAQVDRGNGTVRYRLLETIRQYAWDRLRASGAEERARERHAAFYLALAERGRSDLELAQQLVWFEWLDREHDNLRAVLAWSLDRGDVETIARLGWALAVFWYTRAHLSEGRRWMEAALASNRMLPASLRAQALCVAAAMAFGQGDLPAVFVLAEECLALAQATEDRWVRAQALFFLGDIALSRREHARATELLEESWALFREAGDAWGAMLALDGLGQVPLAQGDPVRATQIFEECLGLALEAGNSMQTAETLTNLGRTAQLQGDDRRAMLLYEESLALSRQLGYQQFIAYTLGRIGWLALLQGDDDRAIMALQESLSASPERANHADVAATRHALAMAMLLHGDQQRAMALLQESLALARVLGDPDLIMDCLEGLAALAGSQGKADTAGILGGAAQALRQARGAPSVDGRQALYEPYLSAARAQLGEAAWAAAWIAGRALTMQEAVASALATAEHGPAAVREAPPIGRRSAMLTRREHEVVLLLARGLTNHQLAAELGMAQRTADTHVSNILHKLGLASRAQVMTWAGDQGLLSDGAR